MSIEEIIATEVRKAVEPLERQIAALTAGLAPLNTLSDYILLRQKDAAPAGGVSARSLSTKVANGEVMALAADGSRKNYITLRDTTNLKPRKKPKT